VYTKFLISMFLNNRLENITQMYNNKKIFFYKT